MTDSAVIPPADAIAALGLTVESVFVPFSQSRNKAEKNPSLNWIFTLKRNGRDIIKTEYGAGMGHCPAYKRKVPAAWNRPARMWQPMACAAECENGHELGIYTSWGGFRHDWKKPILPATLDVIHSLIMDSSVLDYGTFEDWAGDMGYDPDSRSGEKIYRSCLEIALKLRAAIGESGIESLQTAFQDY